MYAHEDDIVDSALLEQIPYLASLIADGVLRRDPDRRMLAAPGSVPRLLSGVASAVRIVDGKGRLARGIETLPFVELLRSWRWRPFDRPAALRRIFVEIHRFARRVDDENAALSGRR